MHLSSLLLLTQIESSPRFTQDSGYVPRDVGKSNTAVAVIPVADPKPSVTMKAKTEDARTQPRYEMIKSVSMWIISLVVVALLVTPVGYRLLERERSHRVVPPDSSLIERILVSSAENRAASAAHDASQAGRSQVAASRSGLHQRLLAMREPERKQIFYLIIRDVGAKCTEVMSSQYLIAESGVWHAHCGKTHTYSIVIGDFGSISVYPVPYGDFTSPTEVFELR